ncbi:unnamed protein product [Ceratitis capitata]|uniref:(Mediterranean fruit fly) hypothetical protein n=1 Tax=Ceratitis capitata TaxID=7213 RepID=A0A811VD39_CERCA|nr:unnamed protein product [Ceratitis capitata]
MNRMTNYRKQNDDLGEPSSIYEERRYGNNCVEWPQRGKPQRERHFKPNKWTIKKNTMPLTKHNMMWPHQGTGGFSGGSLLNMPSMNNMHSEMPCQMQMPPSGSPPFMPPGAVLCTSPPPSPQIQQTPELPPLNKININELFQNLVSSGILGPDGAIVPNKKDVRALSSAGAPEKETPQPIAIQPIDLAKRETIRTRQTAPVDALYSGVLCSNCSERFPKEKTKEYGQHLDWHFRQKRRVWDQSLKASSRGWYSSIAGRMQYFAGEDSEESEKNVFESAKATSNLKRLNSPTPPSCPALPNGVDNACEICQEKVDDKVYHPLCYEDDKVKFSQNPTLSVMDGERDKIAEAAACYSPPSNWMEFKALKLGQPTQH